MSRGSLYLSCGITPYGCAIGSGGVLGKEGLASKGGAAIGASGQRPNNIRAGAEDMGLV
jgi:hypothetical protein